MTRVRAWLGTADAASVVYLVCVVAGTAIVVFRDQLLPTRFTNDAVRIQQLAQGVVPGEGDKSFEIVALVYRVLGLADAPLGAGLIGWAAGAAVILLVLVRLPSPRPAAVTVVMVPAMLLGAVYLGTYSKDVFALAIVLTVLLIPSSRWWELLLIAVMVAYGLVLRQYWMIVAALFVGFRLLLAHRPSLGRIALGSASALAVLAVAIGIGVGRTADFARVVVNDWRIGDPDATSMIIGPMPEAAGMAGGLINVLVAWAGLLVPVPLFLLGGPYYVTLAVGIAALWLLVGVAVRYRDRSGAGWSPLYLRAVSLLAAFLVTQALFEPDYGSALRHLMPLFALILVVVAAGPPAGEPYTSPRRELAAATRLQVPGTARG